MAYLKKSVLLPFVLTIGLLSTSCGMSVKGINKFQPNVIPLSQEIDLGRKFSKEVEKEVKLMRLRVLNDYVDSLGQSLAKNSDLNTIPYHFKVINGKQINAFALPGGYIYVYRGLIETVDSESELAGVLAHEIGHVAARHGTEQMTRQLGFSILASILLGNNPSQLEILAARLFGTAGLLAYSRSNEAEADRLGVHYLYKTGYNPEGMGEFFERLQALHKDKPNILEKFFATHPPLSNRLEAVKAEMAKIPSDEIKGTIKNSPEFSMVKVLFNKE
ncbi:MAG TPA: M48 family metallopeptidase [Candidatus Limnocylindrales bacterium]|nr:M48 family metallopeptidase [Candidatus Limnocylindrales bacterium]